MDPTWRGYRSSTNTTGKHLKPHDVGVTYVSTSEYDRDSRYATYIEYTYNQKGQVSRGNMPTVSERSTQIANKYIMKNSMIKKTSTYHRIVKFHDEHMIAHNGYQKQWKNRGQLTSTITRVHHTGMKNHGSDNQTQIRTSEQCSRTNQICQFTKNAKRSMDIFRPICRRIVTQYHGSVAT